MKRCMTIIYFSFNHLSICLLLCQTGVFGSLFSLCSLPHNRHPHPLIRPFLMQAHVKRCFPTVQEIRELTVSSTFIFNSD